VVSGLSPQSLKQRIGQSPAKRKLNAAIFSPLTTKMEIHAEGIGKPSFVEVAVQLCGDNGLAIPVNHVNHL